MATINGVKQTGDGTKFAITDNGAQVTVEFVPGFSGPFDPITITAAAPAAPNDSAAAPPPLPPVVPETAPPAVGNQQANDQVSKNSMDLLKYQLILSLVNQLPNVAPSETTSTKDTELSKTKAKTQDSPPTSNDHLDQKTRRYNQVQVGFGSSGASLDRLV